MSEPLGHRTWQTLNLYILVLYLIVNFAVCRKADSLFGDELMWRSVHDRDRRDLFDDVVHLIAKREKEEAKALRKRNIKVFSEILDSMPNLQYSTTWSEAQQMLLDNTRFTEDPDLESKQLFNVNRRYSVKCFCFLLLSYLDFIMLDVFCLVFS